MIGIKAQMDVDQLGLSSTQWRADNFLGSFLRRRSLNDLSYVNKVNIFYEHDWFSGLNNRISFTWLKSIKLPRYDLIESPRMITEQQILISSEKQKFNLKRTFAYGQKF